MAAFASLIRRNTGANIVSLVTRTVWLNRSERLTSRRWHLLAAICALSLLAAASPAEAPSSPKSTSDKELPGPPAVTEVQFGAEGGAYHFISGCSGPHQYVGYTAARASVRHRTREGWTVAAEGYARRGRVTRSVPTPGNEAVQTSTVGKRANGFAVAGRVGFHGRNGGIELGPVFGNTLTLSENRALGALPSGTAWLGRYGTLHVWTSLFAEPTLGANRSIGFGVGHESHRMRLKLGISNSSGEDNAFLVDGNFAVGDGLWLGGGGQLGSTNTYSAFAHVGYSFPASLDDSDTTPVPRRVNRPPN